ncbi:glycoside hydrolase family 95-like protein [Paenibacillus albidus]|uniref:glycoside hydrolase family 95-like protein n=1 Tax=Paenibacillus albidus TaxID=2041023 RepID=UPI0035D04334
MPTLVEQQRCKRCCCSRTGGGIRLLPALPLAWQQGHVTGLRARGGFTIDMVWQAGKLQHAQITSTLW